MNEIKNRIEALRIEMKKQGLDAFYISGTDPHASEYLPGYWQTRLFISGFTGSYGIVVVTMNDACLWTDTRYFIQAEEQLKGTGIVMKKLRVSGAVLPEIWLSQNLNSNAKVGVDAQTISIVSFNNLKKTLSENKIELIASTDLLNNFWENRPEIPNHKIFELETEFTGLSRKEKQNKIAAELAKSKADLHIITTLDELAWQFNLRGSDINYNPVFMGFGIVGKTESLLFVHTKKITENLHRKLRNEGVEILEYNSFYSFLKNLSGKRILVDNSTANYFVFNALYNNNEIVNEVSKVSLAKALKNKTELAGFREAMKKDGVALVEFLFWLKENLGKEKITEFTVGRKLEAFRSKQNGFMGESFPPIVGYKEHGAIVHLNVNEKDALPIENKGILLFDSGGQYLQGTTDITRTVALGEITEQQKNDFTLVLKGMIALTNAKFPEGTLGCHLDILARKPLWENGMNYGHGTGHGVGHFLNVHEGPMAIRQEYNPISIQPGMVLSNEPAFYREGEYGIRTENMIACVEKEKTKFAQFFGFETLTLCPIDTRLIQFDLLDSTEILWLNRYHKKVKEALTPLLDNNKLVAFLDELTRAV